MHTAVNFYFKEMSSLIHNFHESLIDYDASSVTRQSFKLCNILTVCTHVVAYERYVILALMYENRAIK